MFFEFDQNNSYGKFDVDDKVCHRLFIEAESEADAICIAEQLGCYWDGVNSGIDCPCCGDRWYATPEIVDYKNWGGKTFDNIEEFAQYLADEYGWTIPDARIYYASGKVVEIYSKRHEV